MKSINYSGQVKYVPVVSMRVYCLSNKELGVESTWVNSGSQSTRTEETQISYLLFNLQKHWQEILMKHLNKSLYKVLRGQGCSIVSKKTSRDLSGMGR